MEHDEGTDLISTLRIHFIHFVRTECKKNSKNFVRQLPVVSTIPDSFTHQHHWNIVLYTVHLVLLKRFERQMGNSTKITHK